MTYRSDEITIRNPNIVHGFSYLIFSDATNIAVNWLKNIIQHEFTCFNPLSYIYLSVVAYPFGYNKGFLPTFKIDLNHIL